MIEKLGFYKKTDEELLKIWRSLDKTQKRTLINLYDDHNLYIFRNTDSHQHKAHLGKSEFTGVEVSYRCFKSLRMSMLIDMVHFYKERKLASYAISPLGRAVMFLAKNTKV